MAILPYTSATPNATVTTSGKTKQVVYNVRDYGATGDGTTDDTVACQNAINAAHTAGGGVVWFPAGTYKLVTNPLKLYSGTTPTITAYSNITLAGTGSSGTNGTIITQTTTGVDCIKLLNDVANGAQSVGIVIKNLCVSWGTGTLTNSGNGIYFAEQAASGPAFYQCSLTNVRANNFQGTGKYGFNFESIIVSTVKECHAYSCYGGFFLNGAVGSEYGSVSTSTSFIDCYANAPTTYGYRMIDATYCSFQSCACDITVNATTAYLVEGCNSLVFNACGVELDGTHTLTNGFSIAANTSLTGSSGVGLYDTYVYQSKSTIEVLVTGSSKGVTLFGHQSNSSISGSTALKADASTTVTEIMCNLDAGAVTPRNINATAKDVILADWDGTTTLPGLLTLSTGTLATSTGTLTLPTSTDTLVGRATSDTLTNKNLTSGTNTFPTLNQNTTGSAAKWTTARNLAGNSVDGSANVAFANKFIVQGTTDTGLSAAQFLGALGTGIVKNTTTTGVLSIAVAGDFPTLNQSTTGSAATLTTPRTIQTNLASTSSASFDGSANITPGVTGTLPVANGGTGTTAQRTILIPVVLPDPYQTTTSATYDDMDFAYFPFDPTLYTSINAVYFQCVFQQGNSGTFTCDVQLVNDAGTAITGSGLTASLAQFAKSSQKTANIKANLTNGPQTYRIQAKVAAGGRVSPGYAALLVECLL